MRTLRHLTHFYPRFKALTGGETAILQLTGALAQLGVKSTILTRGYSEQFDVLRHPSVEISVLDGLWRWNSGNHLFDSFLDTWLSPALTSIIPKETDGFIFHSEASPFALWYSRKILRIGKPCIYFCYQPPRFAYDLLDSTTVGYPGLGRLVPLYAVFHRWFDRRWVKPADDIWTFSKTYGAWCQKLYAREEVACIPPGIDFEHFSSGQADFIRRKWGISQKDIILVTVNKLIPRKNIDVFIQVVAHLREQGYPVKGIIVGDGPARPQLEALAQQTGQQGEVIFAGFVPKEDLPHYYAGADVYLFLEQNVPFGMTPLEAAAAGTPAIAPEGGGALETIVPGKTGFLVDNQLAVSKIAQSVLQIVQNESVKLNMRQQAREHARKFTWHRYAQQVIDNFMRVSSMKPDTVNLTAK